MEEFQDWEEHRKYLKEEMVPGHEEKPWVTPFVLSQDPETGPPHPSATPGLTWTDPSYK